MNCKPGDLALIVKTKPAGEFLLGMPVEVLHVSETHGPGWWHIRLPRVICNPLSGACGDWGDAPDECLRPIRPGDVTDDEVRELYAPKVPEAA